MAIIHNRGKKSSPKQDAGLAAESFNKQKQKDLEVKKEEVLDSEQETKDLSEVEDSVVKEEKKKPTVKKKTSTKKNINK